MEGMYQVQEPMEVPALDLKKERKFCSGIGFYYFIVVTVVSVLQILISTIVGMFCPALIINHYAIYMVMAMMPMYVIGYPLLVLLSKRRPAVSLEQHKLGGGNFMILLMMCFGVMIVGNLIGIGVNAIIGAVKGSEVVNSVEALLSGNSLWANLLIAGVCAPIFEELMFRKILVDRMVRFGEATAVVVSGFMFGLFHGNFTQFFYAFFLGILLAYAYVKTGRVRYSIFIHMIVNTSSTLISVVIGMIDMNKLAQLERDLTLYGDSLPVMREMLSELVTVLVPFLILLVYEVVLYGMAIAGIVLLIVRRKRFTFKAGEVTLPKGKRASVVWGNVGMLLFTLCCILLFVSNLML